MSRNRVPTGPRFQPLSSDKSSKAKSRYLEFKYLYFQVQKLINKKVVLSLKSEQLRTPEIRTALVKPIVQRLIEVSRLSSLNAVFNAQGPSAHFEIFDTPQFAPFSYGSVQAEGQQGLSSLQHPDSLSINLIYVLLLLRYEYMIQMESNFVMYDLLLTKANVCELLAIRMLREYRSASRINLLFVNPMGHRHGNDETRVLKDTKHLDSFNTIELSVLTKSKKFLSQPVIIHIMERIYNGELIVMDHAGGHENSWLDILGGTNGSKKRDYELLTVQEESETETEPEKNIVDYKFNKISLKKVVFRSNIVPKYQAIVINLKYAFLTFLFFVLVLRHKQSWTVEVGETIYSKLFSMMFWTVALSFNFDNLQKLLHIEFKFLKKIVWTYFDLLVVALIDISFILRVLLGLGKIGPAVYYNFFSLIPILLFPRMLSVFNNYEFFNMMILSFKKMSLYMIAMFSLFVSLIFGFFLCFISLTIDLTVYEVAFSMLKLFFGFTPAVWDNWNRYNTLGRVIQLAYLFLVQFIVATILAIVLSNVFTEVTLTHKEEFEYIKTTNLIIYLKWGKLNYSKHHHRSPFLVIFNGLVSIFKLPIISMIYFYEILVKDNKRHLQRQQQDLKHFTFLSKEHDFYADNEMMMAGQAHDEDSDVSTLMMNSRRGSHFAMPQGTGGIGRTISHASNAVIFGAQENESGRSNATPIPRHLISKYSINTLGGLRNASEDLAFLEDFLGKRYGNYGKTRRRARSRDVSGEKKTKKKLQKSDLAAVMNKLNQLEALIYGGGERRSSQDYRGPEGMYDLTEALGTEMMDSDLGSDTDDSVYSKDLFGTI